MNPDFVGLLRALSEADARFLLTSLAGLTFDDAWAGRITRSYGDLADLELLGESG